MRPLAKRIVRWARRRCRLLPALARADAFIASYPKSGRTWLRFILANYLNDQFSLGCSSTCTTCSTSCPTTASTPSAACPAFRFQGRPGLPLVVVSHARYQRALFRRKAIIFLLRDPRDLMVSAYFHQTRHKQRFAGGLSEFLRDPELGLADYALYLNRWAHALAEHRHLVVGYEQLSRDPAATSEAVLGFLGVAVEPARLQRAVAAARFDVMQALERETGIPAHRYDRNDTDSLRMRRGQVGGFGDHLSPADLAYMESTLAAELSAAAKGLLSQAGLAALR